MKKVISIAVSTLLLGNVSFAQTTTDNSLLQSIQQKIEAKKSGLGSNVQTNSGLSDFSNKSSNKDITEIAKSVNTPVSKNVNNNINNISNTQIPKNTTVTVVEKTVETKQSQSSPVVKKEVTVKQEVTSPEFCEPVKPKVVKKKIVKKTVVKKSVIKKKTVNNFNMVKTQNYTPVIFSEDKWIKNSEINSSIRSIGSHLEVHISNVNGQVITKEQFNKDFIRVVQISQNFNVVNRQEEKMSFLTNSYLFNKEVTSCAAIFVQYHLKSSALPTTLVKYVSKQGELSDNIDSSCPYSAPEELASSVNYSASNNISGLIFKNNKLVENQPINFNIIFSKNGVTKIPNDLFVFAVKSDFSDLTVFTPKNYGHNSSGILFEQNLEKGQYILGYSFKEGKKESYLQNINVE